PARAALARPADHRGARPHRAPRPLGRRRALARPRPPAVHRASRRHAGVQPRRVRGLARRPQRRGAPRPGAARSRRAAVLGGTRELLEIADRIRALATTGLHFTQGPFDRERYQALLELAARLAAHGTGEPAPELERLFRASDDGYVTPKLDVRLALFRGDEVLL